MPSVFKTVKKKVNLRRLSALWLLLIVIELFCPALCEASDFTSNDYLPLATASQSDKQQTEASSSYVAACEHQNQSHGQQLVCHDECLCHATAIPNLGIISRKDELIKRTAIPFNFSNPLLNFLPPPDNPPKLS